MPGRRGRGTCLASPGAKRDAATRHPSAGGRPGARARNHEREPELDIIISNASDKPIYDQIVSQMKALILTGELGEGQQLPSIRALAGDLRISVITTKRAYAELELQGFIETVPGKGSFVAGGFFARSAFGTSRSCSSRPSTKRAARTSASRSSMTCSTSSQKVTTDERPPPHTQLVEAL